MTITPRPFNRGDQVFQSNDLDLNNSSSTLLANSATFTGTGTDVLQFGSVIISAYTDQDGLLLVEFSSDGANWDISDSNAVVANTAKVVTSVVKARYFRVRFTNNSGSDQTFLRLQSLLSYITEGGSSTVTISGTPDFNLAEYGGATTTLGQKASAASIPTVLSSEQQTILSAIQTAVELIDNTVSGSELQVDIVTIPTVTIQDGGGSITVDGTVSISGAVPVTDNGGSLTVDGTVVVTDGGGSLTVDGTVAVTDGGGSLTVDGAVTVSQATASSLKAQVEGTTAVGATSPNPVGMGGTDVAGFLRNYTAFAAGIFYVMPAIITNTAGTDTVGITNSAAFAGGDEAHDAADAGNPVKIGGYATSTLPESITAVANGDRTRALFDLLGLQYTRPYHTEAIQLDCDDLEDTFDNVTTSATFDFDSPGYGLGILSGIFSSAGTGSHYIQITVSALVTPSGGSETARPIRNGYLASWIYSDSTVAGGYPDAMMFPLPITKGRITITSFNTTASLTITSADMVLQMRTLG